jgi:hypothetical protein
MTVVSYRTHCSAVHICCHKGFDNRFEVFDVWYLFVPTLEVVFDYYNCFVDCIAVDISTVEDLFPDLMVYIQQLMASHSRYGLG